MTFDAAQLAAITRATSTARVTLISGSAGTGKTTIIREICNRIEEEETDLKPLLCAFSGKAAARLREATQRPASTIHRMLAYDGTSFKADPDSLTGRTVIVDEASMIDAPLLAEITRRNPARLILIGDQAQLPPVGRGQPYHDILALRPDLAINLTRCYRASEAVFQAAVAIRAGSTPPMQLTTPGERWAAVNTGDAARTQSTVLSWVTADAWDFEQDIVLVPRNGESDDDPATVRGLNRAIADAVLPRDWKDKKQRFQVGDRVINGKNLPKLDCWNGTIGTISAIDIDGGIWVRVDDPVQTHPGMDDGAMTDRVLFSRSDRNNLSLAYALTAHKSQGSQYRRVLVVCLCKDAHSLLSRSWIYTAVTRAKQAAVVCGEYGAFKAGIEKVESKHTCIQEFANSTDQ